MERIIARLVTDFENGQMSRRQLIQNLALVATTVSVTTNCAPAITQPKGFKAIGVDHISYQVSDYTKTRDWYSDLLGMSVAGDDGQSSCQLQFGNSLLIARNGDSPQIDHMAYKIENWNSDTVKEELERRGMEPRLDRGPGGTYASYHVLDPDGYRVQISGDLKPGDSLYEGD